LTPRQLKSLRKRLGWSQARLAEALEVHSMTVSKWERGQQPIPKMAELAVRYLVSQESEK
jgi:transcriptional regulator with XRE-family HTH domain